MRCSTPSGSELVLWVLGYQELLTPGRRLGLGILTSPQHAPKEEQRTTWWNERWYQVAFGMELTGHSLISFPRARYSPCSDDSRLGEDRWAHGDHHLRRRETGETSWSSVNMQRPDFLPPLGLP